MKNNTRVYIVFGFLTLLLGVGFYIWYNNYRTGRNTNRLNVFGGSGGGSNAPAAKTPAQIEAETMHAQGSITIAEKLIRDAMDKLNFGNPNRITV